MMDSASHAATGNLLFLSELYHCCFHAVLHLLYNGKARSVRRSLEVALKADRGEDGLAAHCQLWSLFLPLQETCMRAQAGWGL